MQCYHYIIRQKVFILLLKKWEVHLAFVKMPKEYINLIILQDTLPIILTAKITSETQNKGHYVYEDT